jgi:hypothetical protein
MLPAHFDTGHVYGTMDNATEVYSSSNEMDPFMDSLDNFMYIISANKEYK